MVRDSVVLWLTWRESIRADIQSAQVELVDMFLSESQMGEMEGS